MFIIDLFNNDIICGKALKSVSFVLNEFSQIKQQWNPVNTTTNEP